MANRLKNKIINKARNKAKNLDIKRNQAKNGDKPDDGMVHRAQSMAQFKPSTLDEKTRSIEAVGATETPSLVYDPERWELVEEVLLMEGVELPPGGKIPLTIEHYRDAGAVIGSYTGMRVEAGELVGRVVFSTAADAEPYWIKVKEGHLDRFSIVYPANERESVYIPENETAIISGKTFTGPLLVTKKWRPKSLGLVLYPADANAKARSLNQKKEKEAMNKKLREFLERKGLAKDATDEQAWTFFETDEIQRSMNEAFKPAGPTIPPPAQPAQPINLDAERAEAARIERERVTEIQEMGRTFDVPADMITKLVGDGEHVDAARAKVMTWLKSTKTDPKLPNKQPSELIFDERDKFRAAADDSLIIRAGLPGIKIEKPAPGAQDLAGYSLIELARHCLRLANQPYNGRALDMIGRAMTTSDFPLILANVANKSLFAGWESAGETWSIWCGTGSVPDFKLNYSVRPSEMSDLDEIPEEAEYKYGKRTEAQESYKIATYGKIFAISRQTIINDDLNALAGIPMGHGEAAARKVGDLPYAVLTANAAMGDTVALFHDDHGNFVDNGNGGAPGIATIAAGILAMKSQKDLQGLRRLNIRPEFFLAPAALEGATEVFFGSTNFADTDTIETDSSLAATRKNPYSGNYFNRVYESRLDDDDPAAWYLAARKGRTVTVFFLDGVQAPYMETKQGWTVDGAEYKVRIDAGAKAMDWKGLYFNDGN